MTDVSYELWTDGKLDEEGSYTFEADPRVERRRELARQLKPYFDNARGNPGGVSRVQAVTASADLLEWLRETFAA